MRLLINQKIYRDTGESVLFLIVLLCLYLGVTDLEIYRLHFTGDKPFIFGHFLAEFWPSKILSAIAFLSIFILLHSTWTQHKLGDCWLSGNTLIPILYLLFGFIVFVLLLKDQAYVAERSVEEIDQIFWLAAYVLITNLVFFYLLREMNLLLRKPAHTAVMAISFISSLYCMKLWVGYIFSGQIKLA